jgi:hypothetical protein
MMVKDIVKATLNVFVFARGKIMKLRNTAALMMVFALGLAGTAGAVNNGAAQVIYQTTAASGSVELSNLTQSEQAEPIVVGEPAASPATPEPASRPADAVAQGSAKSTATGPAAPAPIAWYGSVPASDIKDTELANTLSKIGSTQLASGNPAAARRYLMVDRNTYMKLYGAN